MKQLYKYIFYFLTAWFTFQLINIIIGYIKNDKLIFIDLFNWKPWFITLIIYSAVIYFKRIRNSGK